MYTHIHRERERDDNMVAKYVLLTENLTQSG